MEREECRQAVQEHSLENVIGSSLPGGWAIEIQNLAVDMAAWLLTPGCQMA